MNREWEKSHRKGFKCTFERGIMYVRLTRINLHTASRNSLLCHSFRMHLWVQFKKFKYKR